MSEPLCKYCGHRMEFFYGGQENPSVFWCGFCGSIRIKAGGLSDVWQRPNVYAAVNAGEKGDVPQGV